MKIVNISVVKVFKYSVSSGEGSSDIISLGDDGSSQDVDGIVSGSVFTTHIDVYSILEAEKERVRYRVERWHRSKRRL